MIARLIRLIISIALIRGMPAADGLDSEIMLVLQYGAMTTI